MATIVELGVQLDLDGREHRRSRWHYGPGEFAALRATVKVLECERCGVRKVSGHDSQRTIYETPYYSSPWVEEPDRTLVVCAECEERDGLHGYSDFDPEYCDSCERYICQRCERNGWREYFRYGQGDMEGSMECVGCYQERMMTEGISEEELEDGRLSCDFYNYGELEDRGFTEGETFYSSQGSGPALEYARAMVAQGYIVLFDQGATGIGSGADSVTAWVKGRGE